VPGGTGSSTLVATTTSTTPVGSSMLTVTGAGGSQSQMLSLPLNVIAPGRRIQIVFILLDTRRYDPSSDHQTTTSHLVTLLNNAGISWKSYDEDIAGTSCPLTNVNQYAVRHDPFVYFDDVTSTLSTTSSYCIAHIRPYAELANDLQNNAVARYNFIMPNLCNDMHDCSIGTGDTWLANNLPTILNSAAFQQGGVVFITWDEGVAADGPIGMIVLSPVAKGAAGYQNTITYTHGSTLRTLQEIFGVTPLLGDAAVQTDLSDLFASFP
jgi:phosphatidylinositol-3-phosphatase